MNNCLFCKIIDKTVASKLVYEDNDILAFHDIYPKADVHVLIIPKKHITSTLELDNTHQQLMGNLIIKTNQIAIDLGLQKGYKLQVNTGINGGQEIMHLHFHLIGNKS